MKEINSGRLDGSTIIEENVAGKVKFRARVQCGGNVVVSGPVRWQSITASQDLEKMEEAFSSEGMVAVQRIQPTLFRIRDRPAKA